MTFYKIKHRYTKIRHPWINGAVERLHQTINHKFYQVKFRKTIYRTLQQLQDDINKYNFQRPNQGIRKKEKRPGELYLLHNYIFN